MVDVIKFRTKPLCAVGDVVELVELVEKFPFITGHWTGRSKQHAGEYLNVGFGAPQHRYGTLIFLVGADGVPRLHEIEANLPKLLFGHNGRLIRNQEQLVLALSRLRWVASHFISPSEGCAILPGLGREGYVTSIEIGLQLWDFEKVLLLASHLTAAKYFRKAPMVAAGESTTHKTKNLSLKFYDKVLQLKDGTVIPGHGCCTRIEAQFRSATRLREAANDKIPKSFSKIATVSFDWLFEVFRRTISSTLIGTLAKASPKGSRGLRSESLRILELGEAVLTHSALAEHATARGRHEGSRIKNEVFDELSRRFPGSMNQILESGYPSHLLAEVQIPARERAHQVMMAAQGWPMRPYPDVESGFSRTMYLDDRHEARHFVLRPRQD